MTAYVTAAAVFGPSGFSASGLGPPGLVSDELLACRSRCVAASLSALRGWRWSPRRRCGPLTPPTVSSTRRARLGPLERRPARRVRAGGGRARPRPGVPDGVPEHGRQRARRLRRHPADITGPAEAVCGEHAGLAVVEALSLLSAGRSDRALALGADAAEPTVRSGDPDAAKVPPQSGSPPSASPRASPRSPTGGRPGPTTTCRPRYALPPDLWVRDHFGAASGAAGVAAAALAVGSDGHPRTVAGPSGVRGVAAIRLAALA